MIRREAVVGEHAGTFARTVPPEKVSYDSSAKRKARNGAFSLPTRLQHDSTTPAKHLNFDRHDLRARLTCNSDDREEPAYVVRFPVFLHIVAPAL
jgi:hypothetical protein